MNFSLKHGFSLAAAALASGCGLFFLYQPLGERESITEEKARSSDSWSLGSHQPEHSVRQPTAQVPPPGELSLDWISPQGDPVRMRNFLRSFRKSNYPLERLRLILGLSAEEISLLKSVPTDNSSTAWHDLLYAAAPLPGEADAAEYSRRVSECASGFQSDLRISILKRVGTSNLPEAADFLRSLSDLQIRAAVEPLVLRNLVLRDRSAALEYFLSPYNQSWQDKSLTARVVADFVLYRPEAASSMIRDAVTSPQRNAAIEALVKVIKEKDPESAEIWSRELSANSEPD